MRIPFLIISLCICSTQLFGQTYYSQEKVLEDLNSLKTALEDSHFDLFAYTTKQDFDSTYDNLKSQIQGDSLTLLETTGLFQQLSSIVNNGHTYIDYPAPSYIQYIQTGGTLFPLEITFENGKAYVRKDWSADPKIKAGSEIVSINGKFMDEIATKIYPYISAERPYFKKAKIEFYSFPRYYWQVFGEQESFRVRIKEGNQAQTIDLSAINAIHDFESKRSEIFHSDRELKYFDNTAYLNPDSFSGDEEKFKAFIDSAFVDILNRKSENLILDLRNNTGGNDSFSDYIVSYFADKPFKWFGEFQIKTSRTLKEYTRKNNDTTQVYFQQILQRKDGEIYAPDLDFYQPQDIAKRYTGKVYVLVNRLSISQAAVTAAQIQDYGWGTVVGEETGEYPSLYASIFKYTLPNTGIVVSISKGRITRVNGGQKEEGVIPDIFIKDHLLDDHDEIIKGLLDIINEN